MALHALVPPPPSGWTDSRTSAYGQEGIADSRGADATGRLHPALLAEHDRLAGRSRVSNRLTCIGQERKGSRGMAYSAPVRLISPQPSSRRCAVRASESLSSVAPLAQGDGGEQRGACEQRGRQVQRGVQRAGEGRVPRLDDLVQRPVPG